MSVEATTATRWDELFRDDRHRLVYPSEHVVRFLASVPEQGFPRAVDIGCGSGRHTRLLADHGFDVSACDSSAEALRLTGGGDLCAMTDLPYPDRSFDVALAFGVFYYGSPADHQAAVAELWRVLRPGGLAFVCVRSSKDWRCGATLDERDPEFGMPMHFLSAADVVGVYQAFSRVAYERAETTTDGRRRNVDWLITVTK